MRKNYLPLFATFAVLALGMPALAQSRIEKKLKLEPGGEFILHSDQGSVTVTGTAESGARIVVTSDRDDLESLFNFAFEESAGMARVTCRRKYHLGWPKHISLHFEVGVPAATRLDVHTGGGSVEVFGTRRDAKLDTSGGSIKVSGLAGALEAHTSGGGINLREVDGDVRIETSGGGIEVASLDGSLYAHTSGGPIRIEGVTGRVDAHTSGGSVRATFARGNSRGGELETSGGSISVELDPSLNLDIDASTSGGSVTSDLPIRVIGKISGSSLHGSLGTGGATLRLHTSGGSIHLKAR